MAKKAAELPAYSTRPVAELVPYANNSRTHSDEQIDKIASSIREFGFLNPIITDGNGGIVAGHGRVMAAQRAGLSVLPVIEAGHLTKAQIAAYVIADNRLALDAGWDDEILKIELSELDGLGFDLALTGFDDDELDALMSDGEQIKEKTQTLAPMSFTHALISIPNGVKVEGWAEMLEAVLIAGGRVDYAGN